MSSDFIPRAFIPVHQHRLLVAVDQADGVILRMARDDEMPGHGIILGFKRYDLNPQVFRRVGIPSEDLAAGLYVKGQVPFTLRVDFDQAEAPGLLVRVVLRERAKVEVYAETVGGRQGPVDQVVIVTRHSPAA